MRAVNKALLLVVNTESPDGLRPCVLENNVCCVVNTESPDDCYLCSVASKKKTSCSGSLVCEGNFLVNAPDDVSVSTMYAVLN